MFGPMFFTPIAIISPCIPRLWYWMPMSNARPLADMFRICSEMMFAVRPTEILSVSSLEYVTPRVR